MPGELSLVEVDELVAEIHQTRAFAEAARAESDNDPLVEYANFVVAKARKTLADAEEQQHIARAKYDERAALAAQKEAELRKRIEEGWPHGTKTVGLATLATRRHVTRRTDVTPVDALRRLDAILGPTGALPSVVVDFKIDAKAALPLVDAMPALRDVLAIIETRFLTIRAPKEE